MIYTIKAKNKTVAVDLSKVEGTVFYSDEVVFYLNNGKALTVETKAIDEQDFLEAWRESSSFFWAKR